MSHHDHHHDHDHDHHHHHGHDHDHRHDHAPSPMSDAQKLEKLLAHWIGHNEDHVSGYREWARRAERMGMEDVAGYLEKAAQATLEVSRLFEKARGAISE
jgi:hypothetical protein